MPDMPDKERHIREFKGKYELSMYWPDHTPERSSRFRRVYDELGQAQAVRARIEHAIKVTGAWRELRRELMDAPAPDLAFMEFSEIFLTHYRKKNKREDFAREEIDRFLPRIGKMRLKDFTRADAARLQEWRSRTVAAPTVNRMMDVLSSMLSHALHSGFIPSHPMVRFPSYREEPRALRVMTIQEERRFVAALLKIDLAVGLYAGVIGETALRPSEGLRLEWRHIDHARRELTADRTKGRRPRYIPMSDFCVDLLRMATRVDESPYVFIRSETFKPVKDARGAFGKAQKATGLDWVHEEDFRHFRATQWVRQGVDLVTVQELLGHADIHTTRRYAHFAPKHATRSIVEAQRQEAESLRQLLFAFDVQEKSRRQDELGELERLYDLAPSH